MSIRQRELSGCMIHRAAFVVNAKGLQKRTAARLA
jgi:hypothetical protein